MLESAINIFAHLSAILGVVLIFVVAQRSQHSQIRTAFLQLQSITIIWSLGTLLEIDVRLLTGRSVIAFIYICYIGICLVPVALINLGAVVLQPDWKRKPVHYLFLLVPLISIILVFTNQYHGLFFKHFSIYSSEAVYGTFFYIHTVYSYGCILASIALLYFASARNSGYFSLQTWFVIAGIAVTLIPNILFSFGLIDLPFAISSAVTTFSVLFFSTAFLKYRFIETLPVTLRQIVDLISDSYIVLDRRLQIQAYNHALMTMFPEESFATLGGDCKSFFDRHFPDTSFDEILKLHKQASTTNDTVSMEIVSNSGLYVRMEITPVTRRPAQIGSIILMKDITESKNLLDVTQAANRAKSDFLSQMSHEIRTPLNAIIGMINIGSNTGDISKMKYCFDRAESASKHLLSIINDILDMSKIEADKFVLSYTQFEFEPMLISISNMANISAEDKKQKFIVNIGKDVPAYIESDELRLSQAITNLLSNAIKFTPEGGSVTLSVDITEDDGDEVTLMVKVTDSGIGISQEQQERLFNVYSQADSSISRDYGGTGLGLVITKQIVELMGGRIWIESELGKGAKFIFTMKTKKLSGKPYKKLSSSVKPEDIHILAVDDSAEIRDYFEYVMEALGLSCHVAGSGAEALDMIKVSSSKRYNIFFVDWQMPDMNGIELTKKIKEVNGDNSIVIMISITEWSVIEKDALEAGVKHFVSKPLFPSALIDAINICINEVVESVLYDSDGQQKKRNLDFGSHTILIVEDVEINREIIGAILEETSVNIDYAENGEIAVSMFTDTPDRYSLILMDIQMPVMDGYEATRAIRALDLPQAKNIPILAMTANVFKEDIEKCIACGMNDHTGKPIDTDALLGMLNKYLIIPENTRGVQNVYELDKGVAWNDSLLTGNTMVDMQHQRIFAWVSELVKSCEDGSNIDKLWDTIEFLENYSIRHFTDEEALMLEYDYPHYEKHRKTHDNFKRIVRNLAQQFDETGSTEELSHTVNRSVVRWLVHHVCNEDKVFSEHIRKATEEN